VKKTEQTLIPRRWVIATAIGIALSLLLSGIGFYRSVRAPLTTAEWEAEYTRLEIISHQQFSDEEIVLDGKQFQYCTFRNVTFVFKGEHQFHILHSDISTPVRFRIANGAPLTAARAIWETFASVCRQQGLDGQQWNCPVSYITVRPTEQTDFAKEMK
jgi:hypothetical protein